MFTFIPTINFVKIGPTFPRVFEKKKKERNIEETINIRNFLLHNWNHRVDPPPASSARDFSFSTRSVHRQKYWTRYEKKKKVSFFYFSLALPSPRKFRFPRRGGGGGGGGILSRGLGKKIR